MAHLTSCGISRFILPALALLKNTRLMIGQLLNSRYSWTLIKLLFPEEVTQFLTSSATVVVWNALLHFWVLKLSVSSFPSTQLLKLLCLCTGRDLQQTSSLTTSAKTNQLARLKKRWSENSTRDKKSGPLIPSPTFLAYALNVADTVSSWDSSSVQLTSLQKSSTSAESLNSNAALRSSCGRSWTMNKEPFRSNSPKLCWVTKTRKKMSTSVTMQTPWDLTRQWMQSGL